MKTLLYRISPGSRAPLATSAVLAIAIAVELSRVLVEYHHVLPPPSPPIRATPLVRRERGDADIRFISSAHLFGAAQADAADAPESNSALVLAGTIAMANPERGYAFISESGGFSKLYAVGALVSSGAVLERVYRDHVVLNRQAGLEKLSLQRMLPPFARPTLASNAVVHTPPAAAANTADAPSVSQTAAAAEPYAPGNAPWE